MEPTIYLFFKGNCLEAMTHYADVLGGEVQGVFRNADAPDPESRMPGSDDMIMNMAMKLGNATVMASDNTEEMYDKPQGFRVSIAATSRAEFDRMYEALAKDAASVEMEPDETFWAERFAMFTDQYGTPWMLNFDGNKAHGDTP
ncbi:VOC family protein [Ahrensia marina]|uniref:Glyoxalase/bleomycin resistance protein/dioxygenase n=1 Tax=Ahrensia marina TaxID=1514904 RepID=A0A0N0E6C2_9HYPH|nr:VOC family protein [Ahrensia marina]KPA99847.1 glyoxalase/bleomycin resistance protein/dioxygenase [Ahrensia marina]